MRQHLVERWNTFWFEPTSATNLAICRFLFFLVMYRNLPDFSEMSGPESFHFPLNIFRYLPVASPDTQEVMFDLLRISVLCAAFGLATRLAMVIVFFVHFYAVSEICSFSKLSHPYLPYVWVSGFLMLSRAGDALSIDHYLRRSWSKWPFGSSDPAPRASYRWPVELVRVHVVVVYTLGALSKLRYSGLSWVFSNQMINTLRATADDQGCRPQLGGPFGSVNTFLIEHPGAAQIVALLLLLVGLAAPLAVLGRRWIRFVCVVGFVAYELFWYSVMGRFDKGLITACLFFVPWDQIGSELLRVWRRAMRRSA